MVLRFRRAAVDRADVLLGAGIFTAIEAWFFFALFADEYGFNAPPRVLFALLGAAAVLRMTTPSTHDQRGEPDVAALSVS